MVTKPINGSLNLYQAVSYVGRKIVHNQELNILLVYHGHELPNQTRKTVS